MSETNGQPGGAGKAEPEKRYNKLTLLMCVRLAAPHTWPGPSVLTTVFGGLFSMACGYDFEPVIWCLLLAVAVFAQSAVNTLNDWADFRAGTDTIENSDDPTDAVLVYDNPNPKHVLALGVGYMCVAGVCGVICVAWSRCAVPLIIAAVGAVTLVCYSSGKVKISYLPLGEVASGVVMGFLIPLADVCMFAAHSYPHSGPFGVLWQIDWGMLILCCVPLVIGIGMTMATQNNCDIERDEPVGRHTLPVLLGRERSRALYRAFVVIWVACVLLLSFCFFNEGCWATCVTLVFGLGTIRSLYTTPLTHEVRGPSMGAIVKGNLFVNGAYVLGMMVALL